MYTTYLDRVCCHVSRISISRSTVALKRGFLSLKKIVRNKLPTAMSKLSFRARALDANKSLPVYHAEDVPDLPDIASVNRVVPQMPTGMEKEEETEHHLQRAISAQQIYGEAQRLIIPTPDAILFESDYKRLKKKEVHMPKQLIHVQAFTLEDELPDYDCDEEDNRWLESYNKKNPKETLSTLEFERIIDTLEKGCGSRLDLFSLSDAQALIKRDGKVVDACFKYWKEKRDAAAILAPPLRTEKKDGSTLHDPYVAFRRRVEKMQTRKNRKNDEASYEKMLALRRDLNRACLILEMVQLREEQKKELLETTIKVLETRYSNKDYQGELLLQCYELLKQRQNHHDHPITTSNNNNNSPSKFTSASERSRELVEERLKRTELDDTRKRHGGKMPKPRTMSTEFIEVEVDSKENVPISTTEDTPVTTTIETSNQTVPTCNTRAVIDPDSSFSDGPDGKYTFRRKKGVIYNAPRYDSMGNWPWTHPVEGGSADPRYCYCCTSIQKRCHCIGFARRRMGRGGRIMFDRAYTPYDDFLNKPSTKLKKEESTTINGITTPCQDRVPPWPHFKPCVDSSDDDETLTSSDDSLQLNSSCNKDAASSDTKQNFNKPFLHRTFSSQPTSKFRIHPYPSRNNQTHNSSINNHVFIASLAASLSKSTDSQHWVSKGKNNCYPINGTNMFTSPIKFQSTAQHVTLSPSRPASISPASAIYQLNFPIVVSSKSNSQTPVNNISQRKGVNTADQRRYTNPSSASADSIRTQIHGVVTQPIVSRQPINIVKQSYVTHKLLAQQQSSGVQISSLQVQPVNAVRANKLSISKGLTISHTPVVSNGMTTAAGIQLAR